jgi:hypothetical protein
MADTWNKPEHVFGADAKLHPITGRHIENGSGAGPEHQQVEQHIREIEATAGKAAADEMRRRLEQFERVMEHEGERQ